MTRMIFSCPLSSSLKYTVACYRRDVKCDLATFPDSQQDVCLHMLTSDTILSFYFQCGKVSKYVVLMNKMHCVSLHHGGKCVGVLRFDTGEL